MRLFSIACFVIALFYGYTAVEAMRTGETTALSGDKTVHRREVPGSKYERFLAARWLITGGFVAMGFVMQVSATRFEKLLASGPRR